MRHGSGYPQPFIRILEQPLERGFRFRYKSEAGAHGGLPAESSQRNSKKYPTIKIENYIGPARIEVTLMTNEPEPRLHVHKLVGKNCEDGVCHVRVNPENDMIVSFQNLGVLHVPKKEVAQIMHERLEEEYRIQRMMNNDSDSDNYEFTEVEKQMLRHNAEESAKSMELNVVRLCFQAYIIDAGGNEIPIPPVLSNPVYDSKSPNTAALKICRMDKQAGFCVGNEEIFLLCERVQKDDVSVRFFELDESGKEVWHDYGKFSIHDVHKQYAIVFRTPAFRFQNITKPAKVFIQLQKKKDGLTSEPKPFTFKPLPCYEEIGRKRQKSILNLADVEILNDALNMIHKSSSDSNIPTNSPSGLANSQHPKERCNNIIVKNNQPQVSQVLEERSMPHHRHEKVYPESMAYEKSFVIGELFPQNKVSKLYPVTRENEGVPQQEYHKQSLQYGLSKERSNPNNININYHHYQQQHFYHPSFITGPLGHPNYETQAHHPPPSHSHEHSKNSTIHEHPKFYNSRGRSSGNVNANDLHVRERMHTKKFSENDVQSSVPCNGVDYDELEYAKTKSREISNERALKESQITANNYKMSQGEVYSSGGVSSGGDNDSSIRCNSYISDGSSPQSTPPSFVRYNNPAGTVLVEGQRKCSQDDDSNNPASMINGYDDVYNHRGVPTKEDYHTSPTSYNYNVGAQHFNVTMSPNTLPYYVSNGRNEIWSRDYDQYEHTESEEVCAEASRMLQMSQIDRDKHLYQHQPTGNMENSIRHTVHPYNLNQYDQAMEESNKRSQDLIPMLIARGHELKKPSETSLEVKTVGKVYPMLKMTGDKANSTLENIGEEFRTLKINDDPVSDDRRKILVKRSQIQLALNEYAALSDPLPLLTIFNGFICLPDEEGNTPLHHALISKNEEVAILFLQSIMQNKRLCQGLLGSCNNEQKAPIHIAMENRLQRCSGLLLSLGSDISLVDAKGNSLLHLCLMYSLDENLKYLTTKSYKGIKVILNERNYAGLAPIHIAASKSSDRYLKIMNVSDIDANVKEGKSGRAPIHIAIQKDLIQNVIYLLEKMNANPNIVTYNGLKPLDLIQQDLKSFLVLSDLLIKHGAESCKERTYLELESDSDSIESDQA